MIETKYDTVPSAAIAGGGSSELPFGPSRALVTRPTVSTWLGNATRDVVPP